LGQIRLHQCDGCQHVGIKGCDKVITRPIRPNARRRATSIVHKNVDIRRSGDQGGAPFGRADIGGNCGDGHAVFFAQLGCFASNTKIHLAPFHNSLTMNPYHAEKFGEIAFQSLS